MCMVKIVCHLASHFNPPSNKFEFSTSLAHSTLIKSIEEQQHTSISFHYLHHLHFQGHSRTIFDDFNILCWVFCRDSIKVIKFSIVELGSFSNSEFPWLSISFLILHTFPFRDSSSYNFKTSIPQGEMLAYFTHKTLDLQIHELH